MSNFDFILNYESSDEDFTQVLSEREKRDKLYELFTDADMYSKIDIYSSAIRLRNAWSYFFQIFPNNNTELSYRLQTLVGDMTIEGVNNLDGTLNNDLANDLDRINTFEVYKYVANTCNIGAHPIDYRTNGDPCKSYLSEFSFSKLALGLNLSQYILINKFYGYSARYIGGYDINNISLGEGLEILQSSGQVARPNATNFLETYHNIIARRTFTDPRGVAMTSYYIIKEFRLRDLDYINPTEGNNIDSDDYYCDFNIMSERQRFLTTLVNNESENGGTITLGTTYSDAKNHSPFRYINYLLNCSPAPLEYGNNIIFFFRIDKINDVRYLENQITPDLNFYKELVKIFKDIEKVNTEDQNRILIRGIKPENILVYAKRNSDDQGITLHPVFIGYELCTTQTEFNNVNTLSELPQMDLSGNAVYDAVNPPIHRLTGRDYMGSIFTIIFYCFCQLSYSQTINTDVLTALVPEPDDSDLDKVRKYINATLERINGTNNNNANVASAEYNYKSAEEIYRMFKGSFDENTNNDVAATEGTDAQQTVLEEQETSQKESAQNEDDNKNEHSAEQTDLNKNPVFSRIRGIFSK